MTNVAVVSVGITIDVDPPTELLLHMLIYAQRMSVCVSVHVCVCVSLHMV